MLQTYHVDGRAECLTMMLVNGLLAREGRSWYCVQARLILAFIKVRLEDLGWRRQSANISQQPSVKSHSLNAGHSYRTSFHNLDLLF